MATKIKKISVNAFEEAVKDSYQPTSVIDWHGIELHIKRTLGLAEAMSFVDLCAGVCFGEDENGYMPEKLAFGIKTAIVSMYTNVSLPENVEKQYDLIYNSDIIPTVMSHINREQFDEINTAIHAKVKYRANARAEAFNRRIEELTSSLEGMGQQLGDIFSGVSKDDMNAIVGAMSNGMDEEKLVQAYLARKKAD